MVSTKLISIFADHLWQTTAFAAAAWLISIALRNNLARTRYWVWMAASLKFLFPYSVLLEIGRLLPYAPTASPAGRGVTELVIDFAPFSAALGPDARLSQPAAIVHRADYFLAAVAAIWVAGFVAVAAIWWWRWRQASTAARNAKPTSAKAGNVPIAMTDSRIEPGVFGIFRPVLLLPEGIAERLTPEQMEAVVAHELCHVRRRDNLTAAVHMLVEAVFWFHPAVWWIGARLVEERELACDEQVLRLGSEREAYAEGILNVCKFYAESPVACVAGISGADLKKRIVRIMSGGFAERLTAKRKALLAGAAACAIVLPMALGVFGGQAARNGEATDVGTALPSFEVASVKHHPPDNGPGMRVTMGGNDPSEYRSMNVTMKMMIGYAYNMKDFQITGGPSWMGSDRFDINAKVEDTLAEQMRKLPRAQQQDQMRLMMRSLLADRCKLAVTHATKELPVYALVLTKGGSKLKEASASDPTSGPPTLERQPGGPGSQTGTISGQFSGPGRGVAPGTILPGTMRMSIGQGGAATIEMKAVPIARLVDLLAMQLGRNVIDQTGLTGTYDITLQFTSEQGLGGGPLGPLPPGEGAPATDTNGTSIYTALQDQLGLRLDSTKGPVDMIEIQHIEEPSEN